MWTPARIAVPLVSADPPLPEQVQAAHRAGADLVELRVDRIGAPAPVADLLRRDPAERPLPVIVTVRPAREGGSWSGSEGQRLALLLQLAELRPEYLDVELAAWGAASADFRAAVSAYRRAGGRLILSHHDVHGTPRELRSIVDRLRSAPADIYKLVVTATDATDAARVLAAWPGGAPDGDHGAFIALAMGEAGLATRVLAAKSGAFLTFAALAADSGSAPGQPTIADLLGTYRWRSLGPATRVFGLVGWPVAHSLGAALHNAAMAAAGIDGVYLPWPVQPDGAHLFEFLDFVAAHPELDLVGLSVTIPHKEHVVRWLDARGHGVTDVARRCGAVNTLARRPDGGWTGENTDVAGVRAALDTLPRLRGAGLLGRRAAVLGAGGAARAAIVALHERGCEVTVYNRTTERAQRLAQELRCRWRPWTARRKCATGADAAHILVNCTPVGLWPAVDATPVPDAWLPPGLVVFDTLYRPAETRLLRTARARGADVITGTAMFIGQAAAQFELWHACPAPPHVLTAIFAAETSR